MKLNPLDNLPNIQGKTLRNSLAEKKDSAFQTLVKKAQAEQDEKKLMESCQEIEALFIHQMLRQMRASVPQGGLINESSATKIYQEMLDEEYSKLMAKSQNRMGIADVLYKQLKQNLSAETENQAEGS